MHIFILTLAMIVAGVVESAAQPREGFWWGIGAGAAHVDMDCQGCAALPDSIPYSPGGGFHVLLTAGGTLSPRFIAGGGVSLAARAKGNRDGTLGIVTGVIQFYPKTEGRLFLRGGIGVSGATLAGGGTLIEAGGAGLNLDVGVDLWRRGRWSIGPYAGFMMAANRAASRAGEPEGPLFLGPPRRPRAFYLGASTTWY